MSTVWTRRCTFGNTKPFRIRIVNQYNDNHDYFYVKKADASRLYGLELEQLLSPNEINFHIDGDTLIEEHIIGVPGDDFINNYLDHDDLNEVRLAKEFIKFNERCFVRLLGDMRAYNYVVEMTPDFEQNQYRVRNKFSHHIGLSILTSNPTRGEDPFICLNFLKTIYLLLTYVLV